ncbi:hypothetical protein A2160_04715, partial [Candidatus Beckwithbacteria bacterium RBG_13_42_9]
MAKLKVLIEGYAREMPTGYVASSTVILIEDSGQKIIVDPGINKKLLLEKLAEEKLSPNDINMVFLTHYHIDHAFLAALFEKAVVLDGDIIYEDDKETNFSGVIPGTKIKVIMTPGHAHEHASLLVNTNQGKVAVAGDVFWWDDGEQNLKDKDLVNYIDPYAQDMKTLKQSRKKLLKLADWVIPGH